MTDQPLPGKVDEDRPNNGLNDTDIGALLNSSTGIRGLSREHIYHVLTSEPNPDPSSYPRTRRGSGAFRRFQPAWVKQHPWLHYSYHCDGIFCRACVFFAPEKVRGQLLGQFVSRPLNTWANKTQKVLAHSKLDYHLNSMAQMDEFLARFEQPSEAVDAILDMQAQRNIQENCQVIASLMKVVLVCGVQGLALRGHRDDKVELSHPSIANIGNFLELVRFRAETDDSLRRHLHSAPRNAQYTSKTIQNELIDVIGRHIQSDVLSEVKEAKHFCIIADEVTDTSNKEQLSLCLRYVLEDKVKEAFVGFIEVERITGKILAENILQALTSWDLRLENIRGQCYDGASNMSGARAGCSAIVKQHAPLAEYTHCASHRLNLAVLSACKIQSFRNTESYLGEIARFFKFSPKRQRLLDSAIDETCAEVTRKKVKLKDACRTRWIEHIDSYVVFLQLLPALHMSLRAMIDPDQFPELGTDWKWDADTLVKANGFNHQIECSTFLLTFKILLEILSYLREITLKLQLEGIDVFYAYEQISGVISTLKSLRTDSEIEFKKIFEETTKLAKELHGPAYELQQPRISRRQTNRSNVDAPTPEDYYRITLYNEFISHVVSELEERFVKTPLHGINLLQLLPSECCKQQRDDPIPKEVSEAVHFYEQDLPSVAMFPIEYRMWVQKWKADGCVTPVKLIDVFCACHSMTFPNIHALLKLALTLPVTSCESERSFSQLNPFTVNFLRDYELI